MLIYTLTFADDTLQVWDVDQKRFVGQGMASTDDTKRPPPGDPVQDGRRR
jgi:hypothetical protein